MKRTGYASYRFDGRDYQWQQAARVPYERFDLPTPPIRDQRDVPCCCSMAITAAMEILDARVRSSTPLSPLFQYYCSRRSSDHLGDVLLREALASAASNGVCSLPAHDPPMTREGALARPAEQAFDEARDRRVAGYDPNTGGVRYYTLDTSDRVDRWRSALAQGLPVLFGFHTTASYWSGLGIPDVPLEESFGGHAALVVGFDDAQVSFRVHDSRGTGFADGGYWSLCYAAVQSRLVAESWVIEAITYGD
jgi:hypothetical protein